jgi:hypothetical protein
MDPKQAQQIARHHLGDALMSVYRGGPYADQWTVQTGAPSVGIPGGLFTAATVEEAAQAAADQLRAQGWTPSHARLEWQRRPAETSAERDPMPESANLVLQIGRLDAPLYVLSIEADPDEPDMWCCQGRGPVFVFGPLSEVLAAIAEWCAANLPLWLPPFPGDSR